jgi:hypothetical protein
LGFDAYLMKVVTAAKPAVTSTLQQAVWLPTYTQQPDSFSLVDNTVKPYKPWQLVLITLCSMVFNQLVWPFKCLLAPFGLPWYIRRHRPKMALTQLQTLKHWHIPPDSCLGQYLVSPYQWWWKHIMTLTAFFNRCFTGHIVNSRIT